MDETHTGQTVELDDHQEGIILRVGGPLDRTISADLVRRLVAVPRSSTAVALDLSGVTAMDSVGAAAVDVACRKLQRAGHVVSLCGASEAARAVLQTLPALSDDGEGKAKKGFFEGAGAAVEDWLAAAGALTELLGQVVARGIVDPFRGKFPSFAQASREAVRIGVDAFPVVSLIGLLLGLILGFQAAHQLRQFGANIYVADLVALGMVREFGPLMTAIILAGRSGSSIAAELGTMMVREEVDALRTMGIDPVRYLIVPKFYAITITGPALSLFATIVGVLGGFFIAVTYLDLAPGAYWSQTQGALTLADASHGLIKSLVFSWIVVLVSTYQGLHITGGAVGVGRSTTASVVTAIFLIIVADSIFTTASTAMG